MAYPLYVARPDASPLEGPTNGVWKAFFLVVTLCTVAVATSVWVSVASNQLAAGANDVTLSVSRHHLADGWRSLATTTRARDPLWVWVYETVWQTSPRPDAVVDAVASASHTDVYNGTLSRPTLTLDVAPLVRFWEGPDGTRVGYALVDLEAIVRSGAHNVVLTGGLVTARGPVVVDLLVPPSTSRSNREALQFDGLGVTLWIYPERGQHDLFVGARPVTALSGDEDALFHAPPPLLNRGRARFWRHRNDPTMAAFQRATRLVVRCARKADGPPCLDVVENADYEAVAGIVPAGSPGKPQPFLDYFPRPASPQTPVWAARALRLVHPGHLLLVPWAPPNAGFTLYLRGAFSPAPKGGPKPQPLLTTLDKDGEAAVTVAVAVDAESPVAAVMECARGKGPLVTAPFPEAYVPTSRVHDVLVSVSPERLVVALDHILVLDTVDFPRTAFFGSLRCRFFGAPAVRPATGATAYVDHVDLIHFGVYARPLSRPEIVGGVQRPSTLAQRSAKDHLVSLDTARDNARAAREVDHLPVLVRGKPVDLPVSGGGKVVWRHREA